jgi:hypothetical protein
VDWVPDGQTVVSGSIYGGGFVFIISSLVILYSDDYMFGDLTTCLVI